MNSKLTTILAGMLLIIAPAHAAFRDLLGNYINSANAVATILGKINNDNDAKANIAALDAAIANLKAAKTELAAGSTTKTPEVDAGVRERAVDLQKVTASLAEQTSRVRKNKGLRRTLWPVLTKLNQQGDVARTPPQRIDGRNRD